MLLTAQYFGAYAFIALYGRDLSFGARFGVVARKRKCLQFQNLQEPQEAQANYQPKISSRKAVLLTHQSLWSLWLLCLIQLIPQLSNPTKQIPTAPNAPLIQ